ncbi:MAG TPA: hypothetical protein VHF69_10815, partial [Candidatus Synoicihabitans sp.]|nr:hypothetical protein [Candidatus Synoicihabitans sp.]
ERFEIELLPALPAAWAEGEVRGLRARGGFEVDVAWREGRLVMAKVTSIRGGTTAVRWRDATWALMLGAGESATIEP